MASPIESLKALASRKGSAEPSPATATTAPVEPESFTESSAGIPLLPSVTKAWSQFNTPPMTSSQAKSVRFNVSTPRGYHFPQVEHFVTQIDEVLRWHEAAAYAYREALRDQQSEIDHLASDATRLRREIEVFKVQGSPLVNADGSYVTDSQQASAQATAERVAELEDELRAATLRMAELDTELSRARSYLSDSDGEEVDRLRATLEAAQARTTQLEEWAAQVQPIVTAAEERATAAEAERDEAIARAEIAESALAEAAETIAQYERVQVALQTDIERLQGGAEPVSGDEMVQVESDVAPSPVMPVDSELPPGVSLPARGPAAYDPVKPGDPLRAAGGPLQQWAPEVFGEAQGEDPAGAADPDAQPRPSLD